METILLLGASTDQLFAIETAKRMGLRVLVLDIVADSPGFALADDYATISTRDVPRICSFLDDYQRSGHRVAGVTAMGSDIPHVVAAVAGHLATPSITMESALLATNKYEMKRRLDARGIPVPWFQLVDSVDALRAIARERGFPLVIKPVDRSGSRGVFFLGDENCIESLFSESLALSFSEQVMVEEYLPGPQISTESVIWRGTAYTPGFADRNYEMLETFSPRIVENGGWVPSVLGPGERAAVESLVERTALALGVTDGVVKGDVVWTASGPAMIEMAARLSGGDFCESLIPIGCGVNIVEAAIDMAIGRDPDIERLRPKWQRSVANRYFFPEPGRLVHVEGTEAVRSLPWVHKLELWYAPGELVPPIRSHADRFGVFIVSGETREQLEERIEQVYETIRIVTRTA